MARRVLQLRTIQMNKNFSSCFVIFLILCVLINNGCNHMKELGRPSERIQKRVQKYYEFLSAENYSRCFAFWDELKISEQKKILENIKKVNIKIRDFYIDNISITEKLAKVHMKLTVSQDDNVYKIKHIDLWIQREGVWYITEFAKNEGEEAVKPFDYEKYKKSQ